jgi:hypothetical protein
MVGCGRPRPPDLPMRQCRGDGSTCDCTGSCRAGFLRGRPAAAAPPAGGQGRRSTAATPRPPSAGRRWPAAPGRWNKGSASPAASAVSSARSSAEARASSGSNSWRTTPKANSCSSSPARAASTSRPAVRAAARATPTRRVLPMPAGAFHHQQPPGPSACGRHEALDRGDVGLALEQRGLRRKRSACLHGSPAPIVEAGDGKD